MLRDEKDIVRLYLFDKQKGFKALFDRYYTDLCLFASEKTGDIQSAEDVVQSVFVKCWENDSISNIQSSLSSYLLVSVRNACFNRIKANKKEYLTDLSQLETYEYLSVSEELPDNDLIKASEFAIAALPERCRAVFEAVILENLSYAEAALELGISINTVKTQLSRAFSKLRQELKPFKKK